MLAPAVTLYSIVLFFHIAAVVVGFGTIFSYPLIYAASRRLDPSHLAWFHTIQGKIGNRLVLPGLAVVVLAGVYLASDADQWSEFYVGWGLLAAVALGAAGGLFFGPKEHRAAELAQRDTDAAGGGPVTLSAEYEAVRRKLELGTLAGACLVLLTVLFMTVKPFA